MGKRSIGATLTLRDGNFFSNAKRAVTATGSMKNATVNATGKLKGLGTQGNAAGTALAGLAKKAVGVVAAYAGFRQVVKFGEDCIKAADGQIKAESRLEQLMMNVKGTTSANVNAVKKYAAELQGLTTVGDEVAISGASQLATFALSGDSIKRLMPAMNNLAVGTYGVNVSQEQMIQTGNLMGKVMQGQIGALSRVGVTFSKQQGEILKTGTEAQKTATLIEVLNQNYGGLAEKMANTPEGRIVQLKNAWGDMQEVIGMKLYPVVTSFFGWIAGKLPGVQTALVGALDAFAPPLVWLKDNVLPPLQTAFGAVWNFGVSAFDNIKNAVADNMPQFGSLVGVAGTVKTVLFNAFEYCKPALNWIKDTGLPAVVNILGGVVQAAASVFNFFSTHWNLIAPIIAGIAGALLIYKGAVLAVNAVELIRKGVTIAVTAVQWLLNAAMTANPIGIIIVAIGLLIAAAVAVWQNWDAICQWCSQAFAALGQWFTAIGTNIANFFVGLWTGIKDTAVGIWTGITEWIAGAWNSIWTTATGVFTSIKDTIIGIWNSIVSGIKGCINLIIGGINGMIRGFVNGINGMIRGVNTVTGAIGIPPIPTISAPQIPMLAQGGTIRKPGSVLVGENGPELLSLNRGAQVTPLDRAAQKTENHITINVYADGKSSDEVVNEIVPKLKLALANL